MQLKAAAFAIIAASISASYATDGHASTWYRIHGSECFAPWISTYCPGGVCPTQPIWGDYNYSPSTANTSKQELMCPVPDSSTISKYSYVTVDAEIYLTTGPVDSMLCYDVWNGSGGGCSNTVSSTTGGHDTLALGGQVSSTWTSSNETNFGYVYLSLNYEDGLRGLYFSN
jgi:hypothetical protein